MWVISDFSHSLISLYHAAISPSSPWNDITSQCNDFQTCECDVSGTQSTEGILADPIFIHSTHRPEVPAPQPEFTFVYAN